MLSEIIRQLPRELAPAILPFLQRAVELRPVQPVISYYCTFYAVSLALKHQPRTPLSDASLAQLFDCLEQDKAALKEDPAMAAMLASDEQAAVFVREFAYRLFLSAERDDSSFSADNASSSEGPELSKKCQQKYLVAVQLLQMYRGLFLEGGAGGCPFEESKRAEELQQAEEKSRYAKWRIVELRKVLAGSTVPSAPNTAASPVAKPAIHNSVPGPLHSQPAAPVLYSQCPAQVPASLSPSLSPPVAARVYDPKVMAEAERHARFAISALHFDDIPTAVNNLQEAMSVLLPLLKEDQTRRQ